MHVLHRTTYQRQGYSGSRRCQPPLKTIQLPRSFPRLQPTAVSLRQLTPSYILSACIGRTGVLVGFLAVPCADAVEGTRRYVSSGRILYSELEGYSQLQATVGAPVPRPQPQQQQNHTNGHILPTPYLFAVTEEAVRHVFSRFPQPQLLHLLPSSCLLHRKSRVGEG